MVLIAAVTEPPTTATGSCRDLLTVAMVLIAQPNLSPRFATDGRDLLTVAMVLIATGVAAEARGVGLRRDLLTVAMVLIALQQRQPRHARVSSVAIS